MNAMQYLVCAWRRYCLCGLVSGLAVFSISMPRDVGAQIADMYPFLRLPIGTQQFGVGQEIRLYGHPAQIEVFDAPVDLLTLLRSVAAQQRQWRRGSGH